MILILGPSDSHSARMLGKLRQRGAQAALLDLKTFPHEMRLAMIEDGHTDSWLQLDQTSAPIPVDEIRAVYWYCYEGGQDTGNAALQAEIEAALGSFLRNLNCPCINPVDAVGLHQFKPHQLQRIAATGACVPPTLITNDPESLRAFYDAHHGNVILKPLRGIGLPHRLTSEDMQPDRLARLIHSPSQCQAYIPGRDIRVHVVGEALFATEIVSQAANYKTDADVQIHAIDLPAVLAQQCRQIADDLGLVLAGLDLRETPDGQYVFFEANPSPLFLYFEDLSGLPISDCVADLLIQAAKASAN